MILRLLASIALTATAGLSFSQSIAKDSTIHLDLSFRHGGQEIALGVPFPTEQSGDTTQVDLLRFYVGGLTLFNASGTSSTLENQWHLIDASDAGSLQFEFDVDSPTQGVRFLLGVDSLTNDAGVHGGALDPTNGMYWAWQTGYINFKLEGSSNVCPASEGGYTYHVGGFLSGLDAAKSFEVSLARDAQISLGISNEISLVFEVDRLMKEAYQSLGCRLMRPSESAVNFMHNLDKYIYLEQ